MSTVHFQPSGLLLAMHSAHEGPASNPVAEGLSAVAAAAPVTAAATSGAAGGH